MALASIYFRMCQEMVKMPDGPPVRLLDVVFYESAPTLTEFLGMGLTTDSRVALLGVETSPDSDCMVSGISWLNNVTSMGSGMRKGEIGFAFFDGVSPFRKATIARGMVDWAFREKGLDVLFGTTPEQNIKAIKFSRLVGFDTSSKVRNYTTWRGYLTDVVVSSMTKAGWEEKHGA